MRADRPIRIVLVDDAPVVRERVAAALAALEGVQVVGQAADVPAGAGLLHEHQPDILILDIELPGQSGIELLEIAVRQNRPPLVMMLTVCDHPKLRQKCAALGAGFFFHKTTELEKLLEACQELAEQRHRQTDVDAPAQHAQMGAPVNARTAELLQTNKALRQELAECRRVAEQSRTDAGHFHQLAENITEVFWITDVQKNTMVYVSPAYEKIWGRTCESLYQSPRGWLEAIHPEDRNRVLQSVLTRQARGEYDEEYRILRPDGSVRWIRDKAFPVSNEAGETYRVVGVAADITEQKELEAQFLRVQRLESVGSLAAGITHDLNNVLAPILMSCELFDACPGEEDRQRLLKVIRGSAQRGADLVKQVLAFSRGVAGRRMELGVDGVIREVQTILRETFPKSVRFETRLAADLWPVMADSTQLHQVLLNLCVNARDAMPGGGSLTVSAENTLLDGRHALLTPGARPRPHVVISVADTGAGISAGLQEKIWDPFFTTKEPGKGTGLGLSTSVAIVKNHGGFISCHSEPGKGAVFKVHLPAATAAKNPGVRAGDAPLPRGDGELVLLVDDEAAVRTMAQQTLLAYGYAVITAGDVGEALSMFEQHARRVAVLIMDTTMPVMGGPASIQALRRINPDLKIIAANVSPSDSQIPSSRRESATALLPRPYTTEQLLKVLHEVLHGKTAAPDDAAGK